MMSLMSSSCRHSGVVTVVLLLVGGLGREQYVKSYCGEKQMSRTYDMIRVCA